MYIYTIKFITPIYKHGKFIKNDIDIKRIKINKSYADISKVTRLYNNTRCQLL